VKNRSADFCLKLRHVGGGRITQHLDRLPEAEHRQRCPCSPDRAPGRNSCSQRGSQLPPISFQTSTSELSEP